ncbi:MAG: ABC transporter permease, partial [Rikenellaceae bacterium]
MARWVEYFIARRTSQSSAKGDGTVENHTPEGAMMTRVATIAVALSVAVMILSLAIIFGFQSAVHSRLTALSGDVIIASTRGVNTAATHSIMRNDSIESIARGVAKRYGTQLRRINPYATRATIVRRGEGVEGILLKGVDSTLSMEMFDRGLFEGEIPNFGGEKSSRNTIVSKELASELGLEVGGRL